MIFQAVISSQVTNKSLNQLSDQFYILPIQSVMNIKGYKSNKLCKSVCIILIIFIAIQQSQCQAILKNQYVPISSSRLGIPFGQNSSNASILMELVYDPLCHDSQKFDQNIFRKVQDQLPSEIKENIEFRLFLQPLPYHTVASKVIQGILYVADNNEDPISVFRYFLDNIDDWSIESMKDLTISQYLDKLALKISALTGLDSHDIRIMLERGSQYEEKGRILHKNLIGNRRNGATPTIYVNGAKVDQGTQMSVSEWVQLLKKLNG